jgi:hypothetical protein
VKYYLVTFHETDGNDVTVFDTIVEIDPCRDADVDHTGCESLTCDTCKDAAFGVVYNAIAKRLKVDGIEASEDDFGFYFECDDLCADDCQGHGGITMRDAEIFETEEDAIKAQQAITYHSRFYVEDRKPSAGCRDDCAAKHEHYR